MGGVGVSRVVIVGAGVAGSILGYILLRRGFTVEVYDIVKSYSKPCGESTPSWLVDRVLASRGLPKPKLLSTIETFVLLDHKGGEIRRCECGRPVWYIIDKAEWVNSLRENVGVRVRGVRSLEGACGGSCVVVDARGPFSSHGVKVVVWRAYTRNLLGLKNEAILVLDWRPGAGVVWLFPYGGRLLNLGGGFIGVRQPRQYVLSLLEELYGFKQDDIISESYSMVTVKPIVRLREAPCVFRVGEAAGFVMALGGEGIRPAVLSAVSLADALEAGNGCVDVFERYRTAVKKLRREVMLQRRLLTLAEVLGVNLAYKLLRRASDQLLLNWFSGRLSSWMQIVKGIM